MASKPGSPWHDVLFSWIHLSDIHIGHGDAAHGWDQKLVLKVLHDDVEHLIAGGRVPPPRAVLVTGDIAFSGATRSRKEYADAREWLASIAAAAGVTKGDVFVVPGNHDVQRRVDKDDKTVGALVRRIRKGKAGLDAALADKAEVARLRKRMARYLTFAAGFAPACRADATGPKKPLWWTHRQSGDGALKVRIMGLNTALLAADEKDRGNLRLGKAQLSQALLDDADDRATVIVALSHHPFRAGWLADEEEIATWVRNHAHLHLSGHVHVADAVQTVSSGGKSFLHVSAGAAHGDAEKHVPPSHGYNFAALVRTPDGKVELVIWPRRWSPGAASFVVDAFNVRDGSECSRHDVVGVQVPAPAITTPPARSASLVALLHELPATSRYSGRSELLDGIAIGPSLNRDEENKTLDLEKIVRQLQRRKVPDGRPCLAVLIDNALRYAGDGDLAAAFRQEQARLGR
ncbi:Hypothetical protein A7982_11621 [Minicystis rosea]|nr:Hypothetical protein A7982_11621 [Minicystis rosea]